MNVTEINAAEIGNGQSSPNVFVNLAVTAVASVSMVAHRVILMAGNITPSAVYSAGFGRIQHMTASIVASATSTLHALRHRFVAAAVTATASVSATVSKVAGRFMSGSVTATSATSMLVSVLRYFLTAITAVAVAVGEFRKAVRLQGSKTATAASVMYAEKAGSRAPDERTMLVPQEDRTMGVPQ